MGSLRPTTAILAAFVFAILIPSALVVGGFFLSDTSRADPHALLRLRNFAILAVLIASAHVVLLGLPAFLVMNAFRIITWLKSAVTGFVLGAIPAGIFALPFVHSAVDSTGYYVEVGNVVYTTVGGWTVWLKVVGSMGVLGTLGGLSFWFAWRGFARLLGIVGLKLAGGAH